MLKRCKSGRHWWLEDQQDELDKCCNGWVRLMVPRTKFHPDETKLDPFDKDGWGQFCYILVHQSEVERIQRLRALEPAAEPLDRNGCRIIN
jgi:hypothetical protein